ncbi:Ig-like domain-containing protein [Parvimonas micra]|uniref:Conserved repeat protein n=1 Tax=Parvimonas micra ATCC 33270 TaxID=411465 RepID=A8SJZ4_9FIRM|nr:Ig-like domain-containing protein [Parvimonas micra]EDP23953.1 conserved repeat protein [Parvimonas micra ATCC 33270]
MKKREIIKKIVSMLMIFALVVPIASQAYAADPTRGVEVNADHSKLDQAVQEAKDSGVDISKEATQDKGTASSNSEADAKLAAVKADYENQIQKIKAAKLKMDDYIAKKKEYDELKKKYDEELAKYKIEKEKYDKALEELEKHKNDDGYLKSPLGQPLVFESEPDAVLHLGALEEHEQGKFYRYALALNYLSGSDSTSKTKRDLAYDHLKNFDDKPNHKGKRVFLKKDKTLVARYTNLKRSYMNGKKISSIEYRYTLKSTGNLGKNEIPAFLYSDPTITLRYWSFFSNIKINMEVKMYDEHGKEIDTKDALLDFQSLNRGHGYRTLNGINAIEKVHYYTGTPLEINGSSVKAHSDGLYADKSNYTKPDGSKYESYEWDSETSPLNWYGAIVGRQTQSNINFDMESEHCVNVWFAFDSKVKPKNIPTKPTPPTPPKEPQKPETNVSYHYDVFYVKSQVEKKVTNASNQDINNKVVDTGSVVNFELKASDFPKHHEEIKSLVFTDTLPEYYKLDLEGTRANSPDYDVEYTEGTRLLKFTAKTSLLEKINKDLTKDAKVPSPKITGKVTKEGTKYENKFKISINNNYDVESDPVRVFTPTKPVKNVFDSSAPQVSIDGEIVKAGQELLYKVTYKNTTGKDQKVEIKDKIPEYTTYVDGSASDGGVYKDGEITWTKEKVAADETFEVTFKVKVKDNVSGEIIKNKANVLEGNNKFETNETTNPTSTKPKKDVFDSQNDQVSIDGQIVKAGQELLYKVTYKNTTGKDQKVEIKDKIPEYTTYVDGSASDGGVYKDGEITWTKEKVAADETFEVTFKVKVKDDVSGEVIKNKANVLEGNNKFETNETTNPTSTKPKKDVFDSQNDQVSIDGQIVKAGQELLYKVTYKNTTGKDQKVEIKDKIPEYTTYVDGSASDGGVYKDGEITWTKEKVAADETFEVTFKVKVKDDVSGEVIKNKANVLEGNNKFETNETTNPTSTKPKKDVFDSQNDQVSIDGQIVKAGQELLYKVTYKNTTGKDQKVEIKDKIPEYTTYVDGSASDGGVYKDGEITWTKEKVAADETFEVTFKVKVKDDVSGEVIKNKANVLEGNNKFETNETTNPTSTKPKKDVFDSQNDQVSIDGQIVKAGQELLYKVTYKNTTGKDQKVEIKDKIPEYTTYVDGSASDGGVYKDGEITWTKEKVAADETFEVTFKVKVKDDVSGEVIKNKANVLEGNNKFETNETTNPTSTKPKKDVFDSQNDQVSIDGQIVKAGQELLYKVTYKNTTGKDQKVEIKDKIPEYTTYVDGSASDGGVYKDGEITWTKEKVAADETFEVTFKVKVKDDVSGEVIKNKANVLEGNNKFETNETTNPTSTKPKKDVFDSQNDQVSIDGQIVKAGQELLYKVTYKNTTGKDQKVEIKDKIPEYTTYVDGSASDGGVYKDGEITWTKEKVAADETFEVTFKVKVKDDVSGEVIKNKANVLEGNNKFETNETTNPTSTKPKKDVFDSQNDQVSIDGQIVKAGQELLYKVTYKNTTGKDQKVEIKDKIPEYTTYVDGSASDGGVYKDGEITWTKEKVAADETFEVTFKVKVKDDVSGEVIKNKANVLEGNNKFETNETTNPTSTKPKKDVFDSQNDQVSIDGQIVKAGQELLYKVTYKNTTGKDQKVEIKDKIPEYTTYVDGSASDGGVYKDGEITWTKEKVAADETFEVTFKVKVKDDVSGEVIKNKANVLEGNNKFETNETTNPTSTKPKKDVFDSQNDQVSIDGQIVKAGQELLYKVTYKNTTGKDQKVEIKDKIPEYTTYVDGSASDGGVYKDGEITWTKEKVAADETFEVTFKVKVKDDVSGEVIKNKANVLEGNNKFETNETTNPTSTKPKKDVFDSQNDQVSIDGQIVKAGQELLYKVTYKNTTGKDQKVEIKDKIPEYTTYVDGSASDGGVYKDGEITWTKEKVAADETFEVTFKVKVKDDVSGEVIKNKANVLEGNNKFETNETTNPTSTKPKKDVFDSQNDQVSIDGQIVKAGQELLYKVTYKNTTGKDQKVEIKDKIPEYTTYVDGSASDGGVYKDGEITWTKEKVAADETFEVTFKVKVKDDVSGEVIKNKANVLEGNNKFETNETTNPTSTKPKKDVFDSQNDQVSIDGQIVKAGQELLYKVTYKNTTGKDQKVEIKDKIPEYTTYVDGSASDGGVYKDGEITWTKEKVAADETFEVTFKVKVKDDVSGEVIKNKANVLEGNNKFETNETTNPTSTKPKKDVFDSQNDQVSIDGQIVKAGQELLYKVTYKNTTGKDQKVEIKDKIPEYTTYVDGSASDGGVYKDGEITWTKEKVAADETFEVTFKVKVKDDVSGEVIKNKANVLEGNNKFETNETTNPTSTKPKKDVFDSQNDQVSIDGQIVKAGQELLYKVTYKNTTGKDQKVEIKDKIPEYTTYVDGSASDGGVYKDGEITWTKEKVAADETFEVTFKVKVKDDVSGEVIKNKANVLEGNNKFETNETTNPTSTKPKKDVFDSQNDQVSIDGQIVKAGQELLYKVTYKNTTGKDQKVEIKDKIPEYTTYVDGSASDGGVYKDGEITWTKEKVAADETFEVTFKVKVKDDVSGEVIKNKANVLEGNNKFETNETTNPTSTKPKKDVFDSQNDQVSIDGQIVKAGQELLYKVTYKNTTGKDQKVEIKDKIPEYTTYVDGSASDGGVYKDGEITWTKEKVAADETFEVTFKVKVKDDVSGEVIKNKANVLEGNNKFETNETTNPTSTKPKKDVFDSQNDQVSIDGQIVKAGQELLYKVTYKNTTGKDQKVEIKDKIPEYTTYVDGSASDGGVYKDGEITWTKEKVAADETFEVTFKVKVKDDVSGEVIKNKANVLEGNNKFETNETTNPTSTKPKKDVFDSQNDQVSIDGQIVKAGQELLYKVTYKNTTGKDQKVEIKDKIPEYTTYVDGSASDGGVYKDGEITWTKEKVAADETFEVTFKVKVKDDVSGEVIKNKANVLEGNNKFETNETTNPTSTKPKKDVFETKDPEVSIDGKETRPGAELLYKVTYKNTTGKEQKVEIKDTIPEHTTYVEGSASDGGVYKDGVITWTKEKVAAGETFEVTFKVKVDENAGGNTVKNKANVLEGNNKFETNETTNPVSTKPVKDVFDSKNDKVSIDGKEVKAGQELLYKVTYKNTTGKEQKVVIKDAIPAHTKYVEGSADNNGVYENGVITWTKEKVAPGETFEVTFKVKVDENVNGEVIKNKANVLEGNNNYETNETTNPTPKKPGKEIPRTGFGANTALYTALLGLSTVALGGFRIRYKKKNNK